MNLIKKQNLYGNSLVSSVLGRGNEHLQSQIVLNHGEICVTDPYKLQKFHITFIDSMIKKFIILKLCRLISGTKTFFSNK